MCFRQAFHDNFANTVLETEEGHINRQGLQSRTSNRNREVFERHNSRRAPGLFIARTASPSASSRSSADSTAMPLNSQERRSPRSVKEFLSQSAEYCRVDGHVGGGWEMDVNVLIEGDSPPQHILRLVDRLLLVRK